MKVSCFSLLCSFVSVLLVSDSKVIVSGDLIQRDLHLLLILLWPFYVSKKDVDKHCTPLSMHVHRERMKNSSYLNAPYAFEIDRTQNTFGLSAFTGMNFIHGGLLATQELNAVLSQRVEFPPPSCLIEGFVSMIYSEQILHSLHPM